MHGETVNLTGDKTDMAKRFLHLGETSNGFQDVPLSGEAIRILCQLPGIEGTENVFNITSGNLDALFQKAKKRAP